MVDVRDICGHVDSNTRSRENSQLPMNGQPGAPVSPQMGSERSQIWPDLTRHISQATKYRIISRLKDVTATHWAAGLTVLWLLVVRNSRFFLPEWAVLNDVEFLRSGGNIIVLTLLAAVIWMPAYSSPLLSIRVSASLSPTHPANSRCLLHVFHW